MKNFSSILIFWIIIFLFANNATMTSTCSKFRVHDDPEIVYEAHPIELAPTQHVWEGYKMTWSNKCYSFTLTNVEKQWVSVVPLWQFVQIRLNFQTVLESTDRRQSFSCHRRRRVHGRNRKSPIFCWQTRWSKVVPDDFPVEHPMSCVLGQD
jgi:hypothetical protein